VSTSIHVTNRAPHPRRQWVLWGSPTKTPHTYEALPGGTFHNVGRVEVPALYTGQTQVEEPPAGPFRMHPAVLAGMTGGGFRPWMKLNDRIIDLDPQPTLDVNDPRLVVSLWRDRTSIGICELLVYLFHDSPVVEFELRVTSESLSAGRQVLDIDFLLGTGPRALTYIYDHDTPQTLHESHKRLTATPLNWGDAQGIVLRGCVLFYNDEMMSDPTHPDTQTCLAQISNPLFGMADWPQWGIWKKNVPPTGLLYSVVSELNFLNSRNWRDTLLHPGVCILAKRPADAGEQAEFGGWSHVTDVSARTSELLWRKMCAAYREACRPIAYYEPDGSPVKAAQHPGWVVWSEETHFHGGVSPDRLGRSHGGSSAAGWFGHDDQHQGWLHLCESYLLTGSRMLRRIILQTLENWKAALTLPSTHPQHWQSTNDPGPGRAVGRFFLAIAQSQRCVHDPALIDRASKRFMECVYNGFVTPTGKAFGWKRNLRPGPIKAYTYIGPDPRTGFPTKETWAAWQDAICVQGLDAFLRVCEGVLSPQVRSALLDMITGVGASFVEYGYTPNGDAAVAYMPIPGGNPPADYYDPTQATLYNGFDVWGLQGVGVVQHRVPALFNRCEALRLRYERLSDTRDTYLGTLLP
jgi:hypothetical protein